MEVLREIESVATDQNDRPQRPVLITNCGVAQPSVPIPISDEESSDKDGAAKPGEAGGSEPPGEEAPEPASMSYALMVKLVKKGVLQPDELLEGSPWQVGESSCLECDEDVDCRFKVGVLGFWMT